MTFSTSEQLGGANICAFLDTIAWSEIGPKLLEMSDNGYDILVGSTQFHPLTFSSYATHPNVYNRIANSTAAGRYQVLHRYFVDYASFLNLPDFSPASQDAIAVRQIKERGAIPLILSGRFSDAVRACCNIWASMPGSPYGQRTNLLCDLQSVYTNSGGTLT